MNFYSYSVGSYGVCGEHFRQGFSELGIPLKSDVTAFQLAAAPCLVLSPLSQLASLKVHQDSVLFTMCETTGINPAVIAEVNKYSALITPSDWCSSIFSAHGFPGRIHTCPLGSDLLTNRRTRTLNEVREQGLRFATVLDESSGILRKGLNAAVQAFELAFPMSESVTFHIKTVNNVMGLLPSNPHDSRIHNHIGHWSPSQLATFIANSDVGVFPSRGEGFGLCHLDYACQAIPLITTGFGGVSEFLCPGMYSRVEGHFEDANDGPFRHGRWVVPEVDSISAAMKNMAAHWLQWRPKAHAMSESARQFTWARSSERLKWILETEGLLTPRV